MAEALYTQGGLAVHHECTLPTGAATGLISTVEITLDQELWKTCCRRGRRCLRDIQTACQAAIKLDRARGVLCVSGSESAIHAVQMQLSSLGGPRRPVPPAVWAELMRTRTMRQSPEAIVERLQQESGCRVHIERSRQEVRLFGPGQGVVVADRLLEELAAQCTQETVDLRPGTGLPSAVLQGLAHANGVTLRVEEGRITVLGLSSAVSRAAAELRNTPCSKTPSMDSLVGSEVLSNESPWKHGSSSEGTEAEMQMGVVTRSIPPAVSPAERAEQANGSRTHRGSRALKDSRWPKDNQGEKLGCACPTCGACRFCSSCGTPTWQMEPVNPVSLASYNAFAATRSAPHHPGSWANTPRGDGHQPPAPDSAQHVGLPWMQQMVYIPYDGSTAPNSGGGMVSQGMMPVCFQPASTVGNTVQGGTPSQMVQGPEGTNPSVMQTCMVPAAMLQACMMSPGNCAENGVAFCAMPASYFMQDSPANGG